jgi:pimeloyl-ACP methyl ester carboxylesterase
VHGRLESAIEAYEQALATMPEPELARDIESRLHRVRETTRKGARIVYYVHGSGEETLLFVNPIAYGLALFQPVLEQLCQEFRVVTVDCRGAGRSDPIVRPYSIEQHARDIAAVIDDLGVGPVIGIGVSRGGNQLFRLGAERPELVKAIVSIGSPFHGGLNTAIQTDSVHAKAQLDALEAGDWDGLFQAFARSLYTEPSVRHLTRRFAEGCAALPRETILSFFDHDPKLEVVHLLPAIDYPVLITHGTNDQRVSSLMATEYHEAIVGSMIHLFEGKGHLPVFSAPDEFCRVLREFVKTGVRSGVASKPVRLV